MKFLQTISELKRIKIDLKDKKILSLISDNSRVPLTQIAKKVGLSRDSINYRIKNYEKKGLIQGYRTVVDISKFGYNNYHIFIRLNNLDKEAEKRIISRLSKHAFIRSIIKFNGGFDFEIALIAKTIQDFDTEISLILKDCSGFIQSYEILTLTKTYLSKALPLSFYPTEIPAKISSKEKKELKTDEKDIKILKLISEDATLPLYRIANKVNLSADSIAYRLKNMKDSGLIIKFFPVINFSALCYNMYAILVNIHELNEEKEKVLKEFIETDKNIFWAVKTIGRFNLLFYILVNKIEDLQETLVNLRNTFPKSITNYESLIADEQFKYVYFPSDLF